MIDQQLINRINELARKKKTVGLTELERKEQQKLYKVYLGAIRGQVKQQLSNIRFVEDQQ
ncbi:uncharacterized protein YnzC (UPF0291/DUF896 family) [Laceyella sediminis]|jgi:uncharacterized protein YnzC (UPF0291/DUF896 family)|uniref:UPF0291 protein CLV36_10449 n=1 Tax=Laceyella sediminis TaxID=573074 RepID=A0ABX5EPX4_9BACL|nr:DUF896 domain-containing protein [Laceyella sediminis]PRZ15326.1 uncharacterized protein YnzC (UPF0291/DUF896 family) [Laceyella sediminis]